MTPPRFRIAWAMIFVAFAAVDFAVIRAVIGSSSPKLATEFGALLLLGALPMANVLAVSVLIARRRPGNQPFLMGFLTFGMIALIVYILLASVGPHGNYVMPYTGPWIDMVEISIGRDRPFVFFPIAFTGLVLMLCLPQLAFALLGGFLSRRFRVTVTSREPRGAHGPC